MGRGSWWLRGSIRPTKPCYLQHAETSSRPRLKINSRLSRQGRTSKILYKHSSLMSMMTRASIISRGSFDGVIGGEKVVLNGVSDLKML